jgi:8-oxo-dGTP diphosphatase
VLLVHRHRYNDWTLPKGKHDPGETILQTALREVQEETGYQVRPVRLIGATGYEVQGEPKAVLYWLMELANPDAEPDPVDESEVAAAVWLTRAEALRRLTHENERGILTKA